MKRSQSLSLWKMPLLTKMTMTDVSKFRWLSEVRYMSLCLSSLQQSFAGTVIFRVFMVLLVKVTDLSLCRYGTAMVGALCGCFGICRLLVTVVPAFQGRVNCYRSYCLKEIILLIDGVPHQPVKAKVQGSI